MHGMGSLSKVMRDRSDILAKDLESLLEARDELGHVAKELILVVETIAHFSFQVIHKVVSLRRCLLLKVLQECACHVSALR